MNNRGIVCFDNSYTCVNVEIALTPEEKAIGLMNRTFLPESSGILFIFDDQSVHNFWMKNTLIPLDVMWLDENGRIIHIDKNVMPCDRYCQPFGPKLYSKFVLEVNGGYADRYNINVGDNVRMTFY